VEVSALEVALLCGAALVGGTVDAISGGGGLFTVPALLAVGLPPHLALGTNKGQSTFGSFAASLRYWHAGLIDGRTARITFPVAILGSVAGAAFALYLKPGVLRPVVMILLVCVAVLIASGRIRPREPAPTLGKASGPLIAAIALGLGAYDGFFGPGAGTFIIAALVLCFHLSLARATAEAKVLNFASNFTAMLYFAHRGAVLWTVAVPMAAAQLLGGFLGAHLVVRGGDRFVRGAVLVVAIAVVIWIVKDVLTGTLL
jgi:uncharacterized membrane protein YfcA